MKKIILEFKNEEDRKKFHAWLHNRLKYEMPCEVIISMG